MVAVWEIGVLDRCFVVNLILYGFLRFGEESGGIPLDNPFRFGGDSGVGRSKGGLEGSVLRVEFREEEAQKQAVMERHVKVSQNSESSEREFPFAHDNGASSNVHSLSVIIASDKGHEDHQREEDLLEQQEGKVHLWTQLQIRARVGHGSD